MTSDKREAVGVKDTGLSDKTFKKKKPISTVLHNYEGIVLQRQSAILDASKIFKWDINNEYYTISNNQ